jgi:ATP-binding cassette subfamily B (MDR/TAP) protein 1
VGVGAAIWAAESIEGWCFGVMGQRLATRLRVLMLRALLRQDAAFFDRPQNAPNKLMSSLAGDAAAVRGAVGDRLGLLLTVASCVVASFALAFYNRCVTCAMPELKCFC